MATSSSRFVMRTTSVVAVTLVVSAVVVSCARSSSASSTPGTRRSSTELVFAFMIFRHGDRTPRYEADLRSINYYNDKIKALIEPWGYGQLTDAGMRTAYKTGEFIRFRYDDLLSLKYNESEIYIRSTDTSRTKMSVLAAMTAVYRPAGHTWSQDIPLEWVPVPYTTVPSKYDFNLPYRSCPKFMKVLKVKGWSSLPETMKKYKRELKELASHLNNSEINTIPYTIIQAYGSFTSLMKMGYNIEDKILQLYPALSKAADDLWDWIFGSEDMIELEAGVLFNEFFVHADAIISGTATQKVRVYAVDDFTMSGFKAAAKVPLEGYPKYGSLFSLELRRVVNTSRYVVLPVYLADPHEETEKYLQVEGCGGLCDYDRLETITAKNRLDEDTWKMRCNTRL